MRAEVDVICIGSPNNSESFWIFQELLLLGITTFTQSVVEESIEAFRSALEKSSEQIFCLGGAGLYKKIEGEFPTKTILWLPEDLHKIKTSLYTERMHFYFLSQDQVEKVAQNSSQVKTLIYSLEGKISLVMTSLSRERLDEAVQNIRSAFSSYEIRCPSGSLALAVQEVLISQGKTVSFAESCTGGFLSHLMTSHAGSSKCFLGSLVTYSNVCKSEILGVREETLTQYGAVSPQTVEEMLKGVFQVTGADFAIAVSGVAGPDGGSKKTPVGTVWFAIGERGKDPEIDFFHISGDRRKVISLTAYRLLALLYRKILN